MKRRIVAVILVCCLMTAIAAPAATADEVAPCAVLIQPMMSFKGTTVNCGLVVSEISTELEATIKLWQGNFCIKTWKAEGTGYIYFAEDYPVSRGYRYALTADVVANGEALSRVTTYRDFY